MTRIADIAGYGIGTVYEYFPNRRSLICELMHQVCEDFGAASRSHRALRLAVHVDD